MFPAAAATRLRRPLVAAAVCLWLAWHGAPARAQCCGDCDGNGSVSIAEIVGGVVRALDGCEFAPKTQLFLADLHAQSAELTLDRPAAAGRIEFSFARGGPVQTLFAITVDGVNLVGIVVEDDTLRFFVRQAGDFFRQQVEQRLVGPYDRAIALEATWGNRTLSLIVNGAQTLREIPYDVAIPAGAAVHFAGLSPYSNVMFSTD
jgi:hypothetical protein